MINAAKKKTYRVKAVIFDMDGVITHTMPDHYRAWRKVYANEGIDVTPLDIYLREGQRGITSVQDILLSKNLPYNEEKGLELLRKKETLFKEIVKDRFIPGTRNFLKSLARSGLTLALVTGTARHELNRILPEHLRRLFSIIVTADDVKIGKPDPEPYLFALRRLNISARDAIVIENAPFGIQSAKAAGIRCLALETSLPRTYLKGADAIFRSVKELQEQTAILGMDNKG